MSQHERGSVLVVDDEAVLRGNLVRFLRARGFRAEAAGDGLAALARLKHDDFAVVLTDLRMPRLDGVGLLERLVAEVPETMVLVMTAYASLDTALETLRMGAQDYILKPLVLDDVARRVERLLAHKELELRVRTLRRQLQRDHDPSRIIGSSRAMAEVHQLIARAAPTGATVLIQGETGTGKELVARAIHAASKVAERDFLPVNLAALPADLVDAALFGHERGAFTGAAGKRLGVLRAVAGGTVFLDEVGELPLAVQAKLLRALENHEVTPLGQDRPVPVEFRIVAATNRDLQQAVQEGTFRQDLYYRLNVFGIRLPPLRERQEDVPELAEHFVARHARQTGKRVLGLDNAATRRLLAYPWPGNVRELSNVLERGVLLADGPRITPRDLPAELDVAVEESLTLRDAVEHFKSAHIRKVLALVDGDKEAAAERLGVHLATLYRHLESTSGED